MRFHIGREDADGDVVPLARCDDAAQSPGVGISLGQAVQLQTRRQPAQMLGTYVITHYT